MNRRRLHRKLQQVNSTYQLIRGRMEQESDKIKYQDLKDTCEATEEELVTIMKELYP